MALDKNVLKQWFKSKAKPNQSQFWSWIDNIVFQGDKIPVADVDGLTDTLNNFQLSLNAIIPNTLVSGGQVTIVSDDGTDIVVHITDTSYKLKKVPFSVPAQDVTVIRPTDPALSRFDVFFLDDSGFHVLTGALSASPVKPQITSGIELTSMLIGLNNSLEMVPGTGDVTKAYVDAADADLQTQIDNMARAGIDDVIAGDNIEIDKTDPKNPIIKGKAGGGGGTWGTITGDMSDQPDLVEALEDLQDQISQKTTVGNKLFNHYNF